MSEFREKVLGMKQKGDFFSNKSPVFISRSPGRLDLMGGNDDYTGGLVFEMTICEATWAAAQVRNDDKIVFKNKTAGIFGWKEQVEFYLHELTDEVHIRGLINGDPSIRWTAYALGNIYYLKKHFPDKVKKGIQIYLESDVPLNKGVSSSASLEVAVMKASASAYGIDLSGVQLALACQWVENVIAESACGIMDQVAVVLGDKDSVLPLVCQPCNPEPLIRLPEELQVWAIDSGVSHEVSGVEYEAARAAAFMGYKMICDWEGLEIELDKSEQIPRYVDPRWNGYLANLPRSLFHEKYEQRLPEKMTGREYLNEYGLHVDPFTPVREDVVYHIRANTRYAVEENQRVQLFSELARAGTERAFLLMGDLMYQSHFAYTECGLGAEETDLLVQLARNEGIKNGIYGAKITGGGAGGTVAILGRKDAHPALDRIVARFAEVYGRTPYIFEGSSQGADKFGVVILNGE